MNRYTITFRLPENGIVLTMDLSADGKSQARREFRKAYPAKTIDNVPPAVIVGIRNHSQPK